MSSIGQAITGVAGAGAGFLIGGPYGAFMGFGIGLTIGGILFPPSVEVDQPKPMNLQVQTSQVGLAIPVVYGSRKVAGNLIWYGDFASHAQTQEVGGKGGSTTVTTGYTYSVTLVWGLTLVKPGTTKGVVNCWAGKSLVDPSQYRVYNGSQTEPDSYLASKVTSTPVVSTSISDGEHSVTSGYSLEGVGVDTELQTCIITLTASAIGTDASIDIKIQDSDDGTTYTDWTGGGITGITSATTASRQYSGGKQYVRAAAQVTGDACTFGVTVQIIDPAGTRTPTWKNLCYVVMENFNLGASPYIPQFTWELALEDAGFHRADASSDGYIGDAGTLYGTDVAYMSGPDKVIALSSAYMPGTKALRGIYVCSSDDLSIEKAYTSTSTPGYSPIFNDNHRWQHTSKQDPSSNWVITLSASGTIMMLNIVTDEVKYIQFNENQDAYGIYQNVTGLEEAYTYFAGIPFKPWPIFVEYKESEGRIYCFLNAYYTYAMNLVFGYLEFNSEYDVYPFHSLMKYQYYDQFDLTNIQSCLYVPEKDCVAVAWTSLGGFGRLLILPLDGSDIPLHRFDQSNSEGSSYYPSSGITSQMCYLDGKIWGGYTNETVPSWLPEQKGLLSIDLDTYAIGVSFAPTFADASNYGFECIVPMGSTLLIGSGTYGIVTYNTLTYEWTVHDNTTNPGLDPTGNYNDFPVVAYKTGGIIYAGSYYMASGWSGVVMLGGYSAGDVNPDDVIIDILTNDLYGCNLPASVIDAGKCAETWQYCQDNDLLVSLAFGTQSSVLDSLSYVLQHHNGFISYYDGKIAHEQFQFITPTETISDANNDFVEDAEYPINISKAGERDYFNRVMIEYTKRAGEYVEGIALADDMVDIDAYRLKDTTIKIDGLCTYSRAEKMAWVYLKKSLFQPQHLTVKLGPKSKLKALPGAIIAITDTRTELDDLPIRILSISESADGILEVEAVEENAAIYDYDMAADAADPNIPAPDVNPRDPALSVVHPNGFLLDSYIYPDSRIVMVEYSQPPDNPSWAGASVYRAYASSGPYERLMSNSGSGVIGIVSEVGIDSGGKAYIDLELDTDFTLSSIASGADFDANIYRNMFYAVGKGYGRFKTATLTGTNTWRLTDVYWYTASIIVGNSYGDVATNDMLDFFLGTVNMINLLSSEVGITLYIKCPSFNMIGVEQSLSDIPYFTVVIPNTASGYLIKEDGGKILTEAGDGILL